MTKPKILLRGNEEISTMIYPHTDIYNDSDFHSLNENHEKLLEKEREIISKFTSLPSIRFLLNLGNDDVVPLNQYSELIENAKKDLVKHNIPVELLDYVYLAPYDECANMLPNKFLPICSILALNNAKDVFIYENGSSLSNQRYSLVEKYQQKMVELKDCSDENFVEKQLAPLQQNLIAFDKENVEVLKRVKAREQQFNSYLSDIGIKEMFDQVMQPEAVEVKTIPVAPIKKPKKK